MVHWGSRGGWAGRVGPGVGGKTLFLKGVSSTSGPVEICQFLAQLNGKPATKGVPHIIPVF